MFDLISNLFVLLFKQVDNPAPTISRSGRPIELLQSGPISRIGHNAPSLVALMHRNVRFKKTTTKWSKVSPSVAAATLAQAFKVKPIINFFIYIPNSSHTHFIFSGYIYCNGHFIGNFYPLAKFHQYSFYIFTLEILVIIIANWQIGQDQEFPIIRCRCPPARSSSNQEKGSQKHQDPTKAPEDNTILSTTSSVPDPSSIISFSTGNPDTRSTFSSSTSTPATRNISRCFWTDCPSG